MNKAPQAQKFTAITIAASALEMNRNQFEELSLTEKELYIKNKGQLIEAEDDYSYRLVFYSLNDDVVELMYDNETDTLISVTFMEENNIRNIDVDLSADDEM